MNVRRTAGAVAATCSVFLLGACGSGGQSTSTASGTSTPSVSASSSSSTTGSTTPSGTSLPSASSSLTAAAAKMTIKNFKYQVPTGVEPGAKITVTNSDNVDHTVTSDKGGLFNAVVPSGGGNATITAPTKPGKYPFHCKYHANMHGVLVVS